MFLIAVALLAATPETIKTVMAAVRPGDTIQLTGNYPLVRIQRRNWVPAVVFDATNAKFLGVTVEGTTGVTWRGGTFVGESETEFGASKGFNIAGSETVTIENARMSALRIGVSVYASSNIRIANLWLSRMSSDGIDIALSRRIVIDGNTCTDFAKSPGAHPDCIQLWSRPTAPSTADVTITNNRAIGDMQGISLFDGPTDTGFDRITIRSNTVLNTYGPGISMYNCRSCTVRDNNVNSLPNYIHRAQLYVTGGSVINCGNVVPMVPRQATPPCPR